MVQKGLFYFVIIVIFFKGDSNLVEMSHIRLRECDKLDGASNFIPWKLMLQMLMEEADIWEHIEKVIVSPTDPKSLATHVKKEAKEKQIILDSMINPSLTLQRK